MIRHAAIDSSVGGGYVGWSDAALGERGLSGARLAGERVSREKGVEAVYSSDLARAHDTAAEVARALGVRVREREEFREMNFGAWEGRTHSELAGLERYEEWMANPEEVSPPGGETFAELRERVGLGFEAAVAEVEREFGSGADLAIVAHGGPLRLIACRLLGMPPENHWRLGMSHSGITTFEWSGSIPVLRGFDDVSHLSGESP